MAGGRRRHGQSQSEPPEGIRTDLDASYDVPTLKEALKMTEMKHLKMTRNGRPFLNLRTGDDIVVIPSGEEYGLPVYINDVQTWKARIRSIRKSSDGERWLIVGWYYSPTDFQALKAIDSKPEDFGERELVYVGSHVDVIHWGSVDGHAHIMRFDEDRVDHPEIPETSFYCRGAYDDGKRKWVMKRPIASCICGKRYKPHEHGLMHFCSRAPCQKWYHVLCLNKCKCVQNDLTEIEIELQWELALDIDDKHAELDESIPHAPLRPPSTSARAPDPYSFIPDDLLRLARQPIVRGGPFGPIGNAAVILRARIIVDRIARQGEELPDDWHETVWLREQVVDKVQVSDEQDDETGEGTKRTRVVREIKKVARRSMPEFVHQINANGWECAYKCPGCGHAI